MLLRKNVEKRQMLKQLDGVLLAVDEICDGGIVMEIEPQGNFSRPFPSSSSSFSGHRQSRRRTRRSSFDRTNRCPGLPVGERTDQMVASQVNSHLAANPYSFLL